MFRMVCAARVRVGLLLSWLRELLGVTRLERNETTKSRMCVGFNSERRFDPSAGLMWNAQWPRLLASVDALFEPDQPECSMKYKWASSAAH
jgi:hypothetical protein